MMRGEAGFLSGTPLLSIQKPSERTRRLTHLAFGTLALLIEPLGRIGSAALAAAALVYNAWLAPTFGLDRGYRRLGEGRWGGLTTYPLAVLGLVVLAPAPVAAGAWVVLATVDPVAAAVGSRFRRPRIGKKSLAGSAAGFVLGSAAAWGLFCRLGVPDPLAPALCGAAAGAVGEVLPLGVDDNLVIAAAAALAMLPWFA